MKDTTNNDKIAIVSMNSIDSEYPDYQNDFLFVRNLSGKPVIENHQHGNQIVSYMIIINEKEDYDSVIDIAKTFKQDSILISRKDRSTYKLFVDTGDKEELGAFRSVAKKIAQKESFYFNDAANGSYYICT
jgi:hypothetical protein